MAKSNNKFEIALDLITQGAIRGARSNTVRTSEFSVESFRAESAKEFEKAKPWISEPGIQGFGIAKKVKDGKVTDEMSLKVYVERKKKPSPDYNLVPKEIPLPAYGNVITDVVEIGEIKPELFTTKADPMMPGCGVIHADVDDVGTFGCVVKSNDSNDTNSYILSNAHVLAKKGLAPPNTPVVQPGISDGGSSPADDVGVLTRAVPFDFDTVQFNNTVDAAIARIDESKRAFTDKIRLLGFAPRGKGQVIRADMWVQKVGRTTDHTWGKIIDTHFRLNLNYPSPQHNNQNRRVGFRDQVLCTRFTAPGDSGAAVLNQNGFLIGLHFAGSPSASVFNKVDNVFDALDIRLP